MSGDIELIRSLALRLKEGHVENSLSEARWMVELARRQDGALPMPLLENWLSRRIAGEPFQYVVGSAEFYGIEFAVGPGVLIPRPETEILVEHALEFLEKFPGPCRVLDLCTGSGCIPLAMAYEAPRHDFWAVDISPEALRWARINHQRLKPQSCQFLEGDLFGPVRQQLPFHLITANPPYIADEEFPSIPSDVKDFEPILALRADDHGCAIAKRIIRQARQFLMPDGCLLMEIGENQGTALLGYARACGYPNAAILPDLTGRPRFFQGRPNAPATKSIV